MDGVHAWIVIFQESLVFHTNLIKGPTLQKPYRGRGQSKKDGTGFSIRACSSELFSHQMPIVIQGSFVPAVLLGYQDMQNRTMFTVSYLCSYANPGDC